MNYLDHLSAGDLRTALEQVDAKTPALRLIVALNYKHGLTQTEIATQYGLARKTVYNWLSRFETRSLEDAIFDDERPGRPPELSVEERREVLEMLRKSPATFGYNADSWTPRLVQQLVADRFDVVYSHSHIRRLMRDANSESTDAE